MIAYDVRRAYAPLEGKAVASVVASCANAVPPVRLLRNVDITTMRRHDVRGGRHQYGVAK
jgi:hypothetical protein